MDNINMNNISGIGGNITGLRGIKEVMTHKPDIQKIQIEVPKGEQYFTDQPGNSVKNNLINLENNAKNITGKTATSRGGTAVSGTGNSGTGQETTTQQSAQGVQGVNPQPTGAEPVNLGDMIKSLKQLKLHMNNGIENSINGMEQLLQGMDSVSGSNTEESLGAEIKKTGKSDGRCEE